MASALNFQEVYDYWFNFISDNFAQFMTWCSAGVTVILFDIFLFLLGCFLIYKFFEFRKYKTKQKYIDEVQKERDEREERKVKALEHIEDILDFQHKDNLDRS